MTLAQLPRDQHIQRHDHADAEHERARDDGLRLPLGEHFFLGWIVSHVSAVMVPIREKRQGDEYRGPYAERPQEYRHGL